MCDNLLAYAVSFKVYWAETVNEDFKKVKLVVFIPSAEDSQQTNIEKI